MMMINRLLLYHLHKKVSYSSRKSGRRITTVAPFSATQSIDHITDDVEDDDDDDIYYILTPNVTAYYINNKLNSSWVDDDGWMIL